MSVKYCGGLFALFVSMALVTADEAAPKSDIASPDLKPLFEKLKPLFEMYYPKAKTSLIDNKIHIEFNTRTYLIHGSRRFGGYTDAREETGPQSPSRHKGFERQGGVICDISVIKGRYDGQYGGGFPYETPRFYFTRLWTSSYSEELKYRLHGTLLFARDINPEFKRKYIELLQNFDAAISPDRRNSPRQQ